MRCSQESEQSTCHLRRVLPANARSDGYAAARLCPANWWAQLQERLPPSPHDLSKTGCEVRPTRSGKLGCNGFTEENRTFNYPERVNAVREMTLSKQGWLVCRRCFHLSKSSKRNLSWTVVFGPLLVRPTLFASLSRILSAHQAGYAIDSMSCLRPSENSAAQ